MDLGSPIRSIAPGLDSAVLHVLAGTESGLSASQIALLAPRGTRVGLLPVLHRLIEHGLVLADPANRGSLYRLNRAHVLAEPVLMASRSRAAILDRLHDALAELQPGPVHASVFGSFARGEAGPDSDIDLLVVLPTATDTWVSAAQALEDQVLAWTGNRLELVMLTERRLCEVVEAGEPIIASWLEDAVAVHGPPFAALLRRSSREARM